MDETNETQANALCKACGLCCTGHLFIWAKLRPAELDLAEALGLTVFRSDPRQRGFSQPCPMWQSECTIYTSKHYPHVCRSYKCKLLKDMLHADILLPEALARVERAKALIAELDELLPTSQSVNFRERLVAFLEGSASQANMKLRHKAESLLVFYETVFGVSDLIENSDEE